MSCPAVINYVANLAKAIRECDTACFMYWHCFEIFAETVWHRWRQINSSSIALALLKPLVHPSTASSYNLTNAYKLNIRHPTYGTVHLTTQNLRTEEKWLATSQIINRNISNFLVLHLYVFFIIWWHNMIIDDFKSILMSHWTHFRHIKSNWLARNWLVLCWF